MSEPADLNERLAGGIYAQKQIFSKDRFVAWSHSSRFLRARGLVAPLAGGKLLDYGCGDGTFLAKISDLFPDATGADCSLQHTEDNIERLGSLASLAFIHSPDLDEARYDHTFDVVTCMEVLEHCTVENVEEILDLFRRVIKPDGTLIINVPIEIGPSLVGKEMVRTVAGWRKIGDYAHKERYRAGELAKMVFAGPSSTISREPMPSAAKEGGVEFYHLHKGFNWKALKPRIEERFVLERPSFTPMGWSRGLLSSQVWFVGRPRP